jgi:hypothetical protein
MKEALGEDWKKFKEGERILIRDPDARGNIDASEPRVGRFRDAVADLLGPSDGKPIIKRIQSVMAIYRELMPVDLLEIRSRDVVENLIQAISSLVSEELAGCLQILNFLLNDPENRFGLCWKGVIDLIASLLKVNEVNAALKLIAILPDCLGRVNWEYEVASDVARNLMDFCADTDGWSVLEALAVRDAAFARLLQGDPSETQQQGETTQDLPQTLSEGTVTTQEEASQFTSNQETAEDGTT